MRRADWTIGVHAAHELALARPVQQAGYTLTPWEQGRARPPPRRARAGAALGYDEDGCCWVLYLDADDGKPAAWAEYLDDPAAVQAAQQWAAPLLAEEYQLTVSGWRADPGPPARRWVILAAESSRSPTRAA